MGGKVIRAENLAGQRLQQPPANVQGVEIATFNGLHFVSGAEAIGNYLSQVHGVGRPH